MNSSTRSELHRLLVKKLIAKYGHEELDMGTHTHPANNLIQAEVDLFMHTHSKVRASDVAALEVAVRRATREERRHHQHHPATSHGGSPRPSTARSGPPTSRVGGVGGGGGSTSHRSSSSHCGKCRSLISVSSEKHGGSPGDKLASSARVNHPGMLSGRPRPSTTGGVSSMNRRQQQQQQQQQQRRQNAKGRQKNGRRPATSRGKAHHPRHEEEEEEEEEEEKEKHDREENAFIPTSVTNEWLILETYQQLRTEEKQAEEQRQARAAIRSCREHLDKQVEQNFARAEKEKREAEILRAEARDRLTQHEAHQAELKQVTRKKLLEEKCVRASQILDNETKRNRERREKEIDDKRTLAECKLKLRLEQEAQLEKRKRIAESLQAMNRENVSKLAMREKQRLLDVEEDKRLMREYQERLDREQAERAAAHNRRMQRYEMIGKQWAQSGAGKKQHDIDVAEEKRMLAEAAIKEKADEDREIRDKKALRLDRARCLEDNRRLMEQKVARKKTEEAEEARYASQFRLEGEAYMAKGADRKREIKRKQKAYARTLKDQMRATKAALAAVQMTDREREMNGGLLRLLRGDRDLQEKISRRLLQKQTARTRGSSASGFGERNKRTSLV